GRMASVAVPPPSIASRGDVLQRPEGDDRSAESDEEDYEFDFSKLTPLIEATPRLFTGDIKHLIEALDMPDLPSEEMDESEATGSESPLIQIHGLHLKVLLQQGIHIKYGDRLPPGYSPPARVVPPLLHQRTTVVQQPDEPTAAAAPAQQRGSSLQRAPFLQQQQQFQQHVASLQPVSLQAGEPSLSNSSTSSELSDCPSSASLVSVHSVLDDVPLVCFGEGDEAYITTLAEALKHPRNYEEEELELPKAEEAEDEETRANVTIDPMERLNRICVWLFFCTHFELSDDARDVLPKILDADDDDIVDVTEVSMEMQGLLSSPRHLHDGNVPITLREATALWVLATGSLRSSHKNDYDHGIKNFVMGLITSANMKYTDAVVIINDALPQALNNIFYRPAPQVLCISVSLAHTPQVNAFLQFHMASSPEFRKACAASAAMFLQTFLPIARQFNEAIREGREVTLAQLIGNYTHSVVTNQVVLKRPLEAPALHLSQKKRREGAANLLSIAVTSGLREESDARPSAFSPVVPRAKADEKKEQDE
ncbi:hypothetical protein PENTCL1PPCAC_29027, partial [Pristionchus entomophagus]